MAAAATSGPSGPIPARAGIGLRGPHILEIIEDQPALGWVEVHSENHFGAGGAPLQALERVRAHYPLSLHGVGLSLGGTDPLDRGHLERLRRLCERFEPGLVSEHLSWCSVDGIHLNDLLPLPYTEEALEHFCRRVNETQEFLGRQILIENPSSYLRYRHSTIPEHEFLAAVALRCGCGILLDVNNLHVSAHNHGFDAGHYLRALPDALVQEIHLAGHTEKPVQGRTILVDDHGSAVRAPVWGLYRRALQRFGPIPTLIEWDSNIPTLPVLLQEAAGAETILDQERRHALVA